ncbi:hypothetical protein NUW54_g14393 [Trametes sanguinea]|uniref:Uncharacterized protein n=1 Tax=Trametes sanguinea TaxID=158606 RepID=A0ACC1MDC8_9APHY|nr:hypothetical protein NUW54_g14393 [Trametes sanguinea]
MGPRSIPSTQPREGPVSASVLAAQLLRTYRGYTMSQLAYNRRITTSTLQSNSSPRKPKYPLRACLLYCYGGQSADVLSAQRLCPPIDGTRHRNSLQQTSSAAALVGYPTARVLRTRRT